MKQSLRESRLPHEIRREIKPQIGCRDKRKRVELLGTVKAFLKQYRKARPHLPERERDTVFPHRNLFNARTRRRHRHGLVSSTPPTRQQAVMKSQTDYGMRTWGQLPSPLQRKTPYEQITRGLVGGHARTRTENFHLVRVAL